jgi:glycosyltransferase involved in cell wall biosynthesis
LFANGPRTFVCATLAGWVTQRPVIWHLHNVLPKSVELSLVAIFSRWAHTILVCSGAAAQPLLEKKPRLRAKIRRIDNPVPRLKLPDEAGVERLRDRFAVKPEAVCIGIFGRITPFKGQWHFLQAACLVLQQTQRARFFVIGSPAADRTDQEYYRSLQLVAEHSGMMNQVFFIEHQKEVEPYLAMMDVVVVASQGPEASPQTILEAMSMGKAVIAPAAGGVLEMLENGQTGVFAEVNQSNLLAAAMLKLIDSPEMRRSIGRSAQQQVSRRNSREKFAEAIQSTLKDCLGQESIRDSNSPVPAHTKGAIP